MEKKNNAVNKIVKKKAKKKLSALEVEALQHSPVDKVRIDSASDIGGSIGLLNSGPLVSYKRRK
ncbi:MAG: hypothetical protein ABIS12_20255 [Bacteroidia bacterium]